MQYDSSFATKHNADAIVVLGGGISSKGSIPDFVKARIQAAVRISDGKMPIIFSGKWSFLIDYMPPLTESQAMKSYALEHAPSPSASLIHCEEDSMDTIGNACYIKLNFLIPNNWHSIILITSDFHMRRSEYIFHKVLGTDYRLISFPVASGFSTPELTIKKHTENKLLRFTKTLLLLVRSGDHERVIKILNKFPGYSEKPEFSKSFLHKLIKNETNSVDAYGINDYK